MEEVKDQETSARFICSENLTCPDNGTFNASGNFEFAFDHDALSPAGYHIAAVVLILIAIFGFCNNFTVVWLLGNNKSLRTPINIILLNLSFSDMIMAILGSCTSFVASLQRGWFMGHLYCQIYAFLMCLAGMTSIGTVTAVSVERYFLITSPCQSVNLTEERSVLVIVVIWIYSFSLSAPPLFGWSSFVIERPGIACSVDWQTVSYNNTSYIIFLFFFGYIAPIVVITVSYTRLIVAVKRRPRIAGKSKVGKAEQRVTLMVAGMICCTMFAWTPYALVSLMMVFGYDNFVSAAGAACPAIFAKSSVIYNPIVYFYFNPQIRTVLLEKLGVQKVPEPTDSASIKTVKVSTLEETKRLVELKGKTYEDSSTQIADSAL